MLEKTFFELFALVFGAYLFIGLNPQTWWETILSFVFTWYTARIMRAYLWEWYKETRKIYKDVNERKGYRP